MTTSGLPVPLEPTAGSPYNPTRYTPTETMETYRVPPLAPGGPIFKLQAKCLVAGVLSSHNKSGRQEN